MLGSSVSKNSATSREDSRCVKHFKNPQIPYAVPPFLRKKIWYIVQKETISEIP